MTKYQCTKVVEAEQIDSIVNTGYNFQLHQKGKFVADVDKDFIRRFKVYEPEGDQKGGYYVVDDEGRPSFVPEEEFEKYYKPLKKEEKKEDKKEK